MAGSGKTPIIPAPYCGDSTSRGTEEVKDRVVLAGITVTGSVRPTRIALGLEVNPPLSMLARAGQSGCRERRMDNYAHTKACRDCRGLTWLCRAARRWRSCSVLVFTIADGKADLCSKSPENAGPDAADWLERQTDHRQKWQADHDNRGRPGSHPSSATSPVSSEPVQHGCVGTKPSSWS